MNNINAETLENLKNSIFAFQGAKKIMALKQNGDTIYIPTKESFYTYVKECFSDLFILEPETKQKHQVLTEIYNSSILNNQFDTFQYSRDPFAAQNKIIRNDNILEYIKAGLYTKQYEYPFETFLNIKNEIINDYKSHFVDLDKVLNFIVACRFDEARRTSYLYMRINAGFGKSFFISILQDLGFAKSVLQEQLKATSASDLSPSDFRNIFCLIIDEFTHFQQELKAMTHSMSLSAKFQLSERVPLYSKIFFSAEKSTSFYGEAGVDGQLADRTSIIDYSHAEKLDDRPIRKKYREIYYEVIKEYVHSFIIKEIKNYISLGRQTSNRLAGDFCLDFHNVYKPEANTTERIKLAIFEILNEVIEWSKLDMRPKNILFEQILQNLHIIDDMHLIMKNAVKTYELILKTQSEQFAKVAKFKQTMLNDILGANTTHRVDGGVVRGIKIRIKPIPIEYQTLDEDGELIPF